MKFYHKFGDTIIETGESAYERKMREKLEDERRERLAEQHREDMRIIESWIYEDDDDDDDDLSYLDDDLGTWQSSTRA